jgi:hypothetical protein
MAEGRSNDAIASELRISPKTLKVRPFSRPLAILDQPVENGHQEDSNDPWR